MKLSACDGSANIGRFAIVVVRSEVQGQKPATRPCVRSSILQIAAALNFEFHDD